MYGEPAPERDDAAAAPLGVKIVVIILLVCGLALAALPLTVYLLGPRDAATESEDSAAPSPPIDGDIVPAETADAAAEPGTLETGPADPESAATASSEPTAPSRRGPFAMPEGWDEKWRPWFEHIDWVIGPEAGMAAARETGKPMMLFYTATW